MSGPPKKIEGRAPRHQDRPSTKLSTHDSADNRNATGNATSTALSANAARVLTDRIKVGGVEAVWELVKQAYEQRAWNALGYSSLDDYCTREFGTTRLRLQREERPEVVASLRESGLSIRAIASATGHDPKTTQSDLWSGVGNSHTSDISTESDAVAEELISTTDLPGDMSEETPGQTGRVYGVLDHPERRGVR